MKEFKEIKCPKCGQKIPENCLVHGELNNNYEVVKRCDCVNTPIKGKIVKN